MKHYIFTALVLVTLFACSDDETKYSVDPELAPYVESFYTEAAERGVDIPKNLIGEFKLTQAVTQSYTKHDQNYFYFHTTIFHELEKQEFENLIEAQVYHRLGQQFLKRSPDTLIYSYMNPLYLDSIWFPGEDREVLLDELFGK